ncbi:hypothetical protein AVEN_250245-1 [Araneus ventricosus]|uniref:Uncharacterized protein n=1 Tax=Araneus ventricosus TaxID=182803 RepID=A0A4Y2FG31_ARAVE|nr:hypothetical protein AVEN_250245-1 [Araneus ventricosus]
MQKKLKPLRLKTFTTELICPKEETKKDFSILLISAKDNILQILIDYVEQGKGIIFYINVFARFVRISSEDEEESCEPHFRSNICTLLPGEPVNIDSSINKVQ